MASVVNERNGRRRIEFFAADGKRKRVRLGKRSELAAGKIKERIEQLLRVDTDGIDKGLADWLTKIEPKLHSRLAKLGLVKPRSTESAELGKFIDAFLASRPDFKHFTVVNFKTVRRLMVQFFGETRNIRTIKPADAEAFRQYMIDGDADQKPLGENSIRRTIGRARQLFKAAIRRELYQGANPFDGMVAAVGCNDARKFFVTRDAIDKVIEKCPNTTWKVIVALSRYGGLRCPSEHLALKWEHVDFENGRIIVPSPKTEHHAGKASRMIPLFAELRPLLEALLGEQVLTDDAGKAGDFVITKYRDRGVNMRTHFERIIRKAGLEPWPKLFHNLRASRETELADEYPLHVVCEWIGNSRAIAQKHYLQTTDTHFARASKSKEAQNPALQDSAPSAVEGKNESEDDEPPADDTPLPQAVSSLYPHRGQSDSTNACGKLKKAPTSGAQSGAADDAVTVAQLLADVARCAALTDTTRATITALLRSALR